MVEFLLMSFNQSSEVTIQSGFHHHIRVFVGEFQRKKKHIFLSINCVLTYSYHRYYSVKHEVQRA